MDDPVGTYAPYEEGLAKGVYIMNADGVTPLSGKVSVDYFAMCIGLLKHKNQVLFNIRTLLFHSAESQRHDFKQKLNTYFF